MADPTIVLLLQIILGAVAVSLVCVAIVATLWALDAIFKTTRAYAQILEWHAAWKRENRPRRAKPIPIVEDSDG